MLAFSSNLLETCPNIWDYIQGLRDREDITIFLTTHYMDEAEYCDRIAIIDNGEIGRWTRRTR